MWNSESGAPAVRSAPADIFEQDLDSTGGLHEVECKSAVDPDPSAALNRIHTCPMASGTYHSRKAPLPLPMTPIRFASNRPTGCDPFLSMLASPNLHPNRGSTDRPSRVALPAGEISPYSACFRQAVRSPGYSASNMCVRRSDEYRDARVESLRAKAHRHSRLCPSENVRVQP